MAEMNEAQRDNLVYEDTARRRSAARPSDDPSLPASPFYYLGQMYFPQSKMEAEEIYRTYRCRDRIVLGYNWDDFYDIAAAHNAGSYNTFMCCDREVMPCSSHFLEILRNNAKNANW